MIPQRASLVAFHRGEGFEFHVDVGVAAHIDSNVADRATGEGEGRLVDRRGDRDPRISACSILTTGISSPIWENSFDSTAADRSNSTSHC